MFLRIKDLALPALCLAFSFVAVSAQDSASPSTQTTASANERYRIGYRDVVKVDVYGHANLSQTVPVGPAGTISLFRLSKPLVAACKTESELADDIASAYKESVLRNPLVQVMITERRSQPVGVIGAVEKPQTLTLDRRVQLLELLAMVGGPNKEAGTRLIVARSGSNSFCRASDMPAQEDSIAVADLKVRDVLQGKTSFWVEPGDVVYILSSDIVYIYGNVNKQGAFKIQDPITLTQAIATAEGFKGSVKKDKIRVLRSKEGSSEREELIFDLNQIEKRKIPDPFLQPNDIVAVSEDKTKAILKGFVDSVKGAIPNAVYRIP